MLCDKNATTLQKLWQVRWTMRGLMPVKPVVQMTNNIVKLPPHKAIDFPIND